MSLRIYDNEQRAIARIQEIAEQYNIQTGLIRRRTGNLTYYMLTWDGQATFPEDDEQ